MQMRVFYSSLSITQDVQFGERDLSHYATCVSTERVPNWPHHSFYPLYPNLITNLAGTTHPNSYVQQDISLSLLH